MLIYYKMIDTRKPLREDQRYCKCGAKIPKQFLQCYKCYAQTLSNTTKKYVK